MDWGMAFLAIVVFLILREFVTWYWKQNAVVHELKEIRKLMKTLTEGLK